MLFYCFKKKIHRFWKLTQVDFDLFRSFYKIYFLIANQTQLLLGLANTIPNCSWVWCCQNWYLSLVLQIPCLDLATFVWPSTWAWQYATPKRDMCWALVRPKYNMGLVGVTKPVNLVWCATGPTRWVWHMFPKSVEPEIFVITAQASLD